FVIATKWVKKPFIDSMGKWFGIKEMKQRNTIQKKLSKFRASEVAMKVSQSSEWKEWTSDLIYNLRGRMKTLIRTEKILKNRNEHMQKRSVYPFNSSKSCWVTKNRMADISEGSERTPYKPKVMNIKRPKPTYLEEPVVPIDSSEPRLQDIIQDTRAASTPGSNGVSYNVYKVNQTLLDANKSHMQKTQVDR
ncbi:hypothetical protein CHS0354_031410, partial [Potamilus streckersoni]